MPEDRSHAPGREAAELLPVVYDKLRALAGRFMQQERPDHTLQPTALVHEAYLRLARGGSVPWAGKTHFFAVAATQMRRILVEHARSRRTHRRGGASRRVTLEDRLAVTPNGLVDTLALDEALDRLARLSARQGRVVELRFFGGLSVEEVAEMLEVSVGTVKGDWRVARAWLARELSIERDEEPGRP